MDPALAVHGDDGIYRTVEDCPKSALAVLNGQLDQGALGDILADTIDTTELPAGIELDIRVVLNPGG